MTKTHTDQIIDRLGIEQLRELHAIAWFCDAGNDGRMSIIPSSGRKRYEVGGESYPLIETGCVRLVGRAYRPLHNRSMPVIDILHQGRKVLLRAKVRGMDLDPPQDQAFDDEAA